MSIQKLDFVAEDKWDMKKILVGVLVIGLIVATSFWWFFNEGKLGQVKGVKIEKSNQKFSSDSSTISLPSQVELQEKMNNIKQEVMNLNVSEVASSSPQIQKVIKDLKSLEEYPRTKASEVCQQICNSL